MFIIASRQKKVNTSTLNFYVRKYALLFSTFVQYSSPIFKYANGKRKENTKIKKEENLHLFIKICYDSSI